MLFPNLDSQVIKAAEKPRLFKTYLSILIICPRNFDIRVIHNLKLLGGRAQPPAVSRTTRARPSNISWAGSQLAKFEGLHFFLSLIKVCLI